MRLKIETYRRHLKATKYTLKTNNYFVLWFAIACTVTLPSVYITLDSQYNLIE